MAVSNDIHHLCSAEQPLCPHVQGGGGPIPGPPPPSIHWLKAVSPAGCFRDLYALFSPGCKKWSGVYVVGLFCLTCEELVTAPSWAVLVRPVISFSQSQASQVLVSTWMGDRYAAGCWAIGALHTFWRLFQVSNLLSRFLLSMHHCGQVGEFVHVVRLIWV